MKSTTEAILGVVSLVVLLVTAYFLMSSISNQLPGVLTYTSMSQFISTIIIDSALIIVTICSYITMRSLDFDMLERRFWKGLFLALVVYSLIVILRNYVFPAIGYGESPTIYIQIGFAVAGFLYAYGIVKLLRDLGIEVLKKQKVLLTVLGVSIILILSLFFIKPIIAGQSVFVIGLTYLLVAATCASVFPYSLLLYLKLGHGSLRIPFLFIAISTTMLVVYVSALTIMIANGIGNYRESLFYIIPYFLFIGFLLISLVTRIIIARRISSKVNGSHILEETKHS